MTVAIPNDRHRNQTIIIKPPHKPLNCDSQLYPFRLEIAIIFGGDALEFQHAIIGVGHALFVEHLIADAPNLLFCRLVGANLHLAHN